MNHTQRTLEQDKAGHETKHSNLQCKEGEVHVKKDPTWVNWFTFTQTKATRSQKYLFTRFPRNVCSASTVHEYVLQLTRGAIHARYAPQHKMEIKANTILP